MTRVAILGATGYTALELIKILLRHPEARITALTSRTEGNKDVAAVHPQFAGRLKLKFEDLSPEAVAERADCVFCCLPHGAAAAVVPQLLAAGKKVVDFSADYRLSSPAVYEQWYGLKHPDPGRLGKTAYGLPELFRSEIRSAALVANPGCYPTSAILALTPLVKAGLVEPTGIIVDSKSGVSGAGRTPKLNFHYPECNESFSAYGVGTHRHMPEIEEVLSRGAGQAASVIFTPHLVPMDRGILSTIYSTPKGNLTAAQAMSALREFYADEPFVQVVDNLPATKDVSGSNYSHITARLVRDRLITISVIDNLVKGASGAAAQNFNVMFGYPETMALL